MLLGMQQGTKEEYSVSIYLQHRMKALLRFPIKQQQQKNQTKSLPVKQIHVKLQDSVWKLISACLISVSWPTENGSV